MLAEPPSCLHRNPDREFAVHRKSDADSHDAVARQGISPIRGAGPGQCAPRIRDLCHGLAADFRPYWLATWLASLRNE
jgi:hypothetical protein